MRKETSHTLGSPTRTRTRRLPLRKSHVSSHRPNRHHRTKPTPPDKFSFKSGPNRHHRTIPTECIHLIISRSWVRSPPALPPDIQIADYLAVVQGTHSRFAWEIAFLVFVRQNSIL